MEKLSNIGIGTDIVGVDAFRSHTKKSRFLEKIFTKKELDYCFEKKDVAPYLAARYAGKEAVVKALSNLIESNISYNEIEIIKNKKGIPQVRLLRKGLENIEAIISLSHCDDKALAYVIMRKK